MLGRADSLREKLALPLAQPLHGLAFGQDTLESTGLSAFARGLSLALPNDALSGSVGGLLSGRDLHKKLGLASVGGRFLSR